jgi:hypothetical protein
VFNTISILIMMASAMTSTPSISTTGYSHIKSSRSAYGMGNTTLTTTQTIERVIFAFAGIAMFNAIELSTAIWFRFRQRRGLYFWSLIVATCGILPYTLGLLFKFFGVIRGHPGVYWAIAMVDLGWQCMVTGQSVVLYSR